MPQECNYQHHLQLALDNHEFRLVYQPIYCLTTKTLVGLEALVRWQSSSGAWIPPAQFIPLAEQSGLIIPLGNWILHTACQQMRQWQNTYPEYRALALSVNVSIVQLQQEDFVKTVDDIFATTELDPRQLHLEVTETSVLEQPQTVRATLEQLRQRQIQIHLDDFGTGYSSLRYLHDLPVDVIKIDRYFVHNMLDDPKSLAIVQGLIYLSNLCDLRVIIEGLELKEQVELAVHLGCRYGQGYFLSRPIPPAQIEKLLLTGSNVPKQRAKKLRQSHKLRNQHRGLWRLPPMSIAN